MIAIQMLTVLDARVLQAMYARQIAKEVSLRIFGFGLWAIALTTLAFINGAVNSYQLGKDARAWWERYNSSAAVVYGKIAIAVALCSSEIKARQLGEAIALKVDKVYLDLAAFDEKASIWVLIEGDRAIRFAVASVDRACELSAVGVRAIAG